MKEMCCEICGSSDIDIIYDDYIRDGAPGTRTLEKYKMYQCKCCKTIWHNHRAEENKVFYQSREYRESLEGTSDVDEFYHLHDFESLDKFNYCGTTIFRKANVADIGCGGGSFLDYLSGVANNIIAVEPSLEYRKSLQERGYHVYGYASEALKDWRGKLNVVTSFDVIEHVDDPIEFMKDVYDLMDLGGCGVIGTPTDCPLLRRMLGKLYEQELLFSYQHNWIFNEDGLSRCCKSAGFTDIKIKSIQRYGLSNAFAWLNYKKPMGHINYECVTETLDDCFRRELEKQGYADYIVAYVKK